MASMHALRSSTSLSSRASSWPRSSRALPRSFPGGRKEVAQRPVPHDYVLIVLLLLLAVRRLVFLYRQALKDHRLHDISLVLDCCPRLSRQHRGFCGRFSWGDVQGGEDLHLLLQTQPRALPSSVRLAASSRFRAFRYVPELACTFRLPAAAGGACLEGKHTEQRRLISLWPSSSTSPQIPCSLPPHPPRQWGPSEAFDVKMLSWQRVRMLHCCCCCCCCCYCCCYCCCSCGQ